MVVAFKAATLTWRLLYADDVRVVAAPKSAADSAPPAESKALDYGLISSLHLFGEPIQSATPDVVDVVNAPKTNLQLTLRGIFQSGPSGANVAIVADSRNVEAPYRVGDKLPGDAVIRKILPYSILLERNGRMETLDLPTEDIQGAGANGGTAAGTDPGLSSRTSATGRSRGAPAKGPNRGGAKVDQVGRLPRTLLANPVAINEYLRFEPVNVNGRLKGYRVEPASEDSLFREAGLQQGDMVVRINGILVSAQDELMKVFQGLGTADHMTLDVDNDGSRRKLEIRLD
jgi:general secretion pathway protein C